MAELYERLVAGKAKREFEKASADKKLWLRGWNAAIEFAVKQLRLSCDETEATLQAGEPTNEQAATDA